MRVLDQLDDPRDAAGQMEADLALLGAMAAGGPPVLRLYRWSPPALSLGRFQAADDVDAAACERLRVEVVRRPTGGGALLHGGDLTYAVALRRPVGRAGSVAALHARLALGVIEGLATLGVDAAVACGEGPSGPACFTAGRGADLRVGERKLCGSAQVHRNGAVLQHGSIRLRSLGFDEADLLRAPDEAARARTRARLQAGTVTLADLGAPTDPRRVGQAVAAGFRRLDLR